MNKIKNTNVYICGYTLPFSLIKMTEKRGFWRWWLFKGSKEDVTYKILFIYSSIVTCLMFAFPIFFPDVFFPFYNTYCHSEYLYLLTAIHGWICMLIIGVVLLIKETHEEYKDTLKK